MFRIKKARGTKDLSFTDMQKHLHIIETAREMAGNFGFENFDTPIFENTEVFKRPLGETSDVVTKEMYTFDTRGGANITLRPEGTAGIVRAYIENGWADRGVIKAFYNGPMFRYERPQKGRQRQFHQFGVELIGSGSFIADIEIISLGQLILEKLGLMDERMKLHLNTLGDMESRLNYRKILVEYLNDYSDELSNDSKIRLEKNPLRILDSKDKGDKNILKNAPKCIDYYNQKSLDFFQNVCEGLDNLNIKYTVDSKLVRGFDYYTHTVFEFITDRVGAQGTVLAGGRYDGLVKKMGGADTSGIGFAAGIERLCLMMENVKTINDKVVVIAIDKKSINICNKISYNLRNYNISVDNSFKTNLKKNFKYASNIKAKFAVVIGEDEIKNSVVVLKNLNERTEEKVKMKNLVKIIKEKM